MATKNLDFIIFGASGFTGQYVVETASRLCGNLKWAVAGRDEQKLQAVLDKCKSKCEIIKADVNDEGSLLKMTARANVLINVVGPYRKFGEPVVKACVETSTNLVDLCGEPEFLERVESKYAQAVKEKGCLIIESCGFDSIPADLGVALLAKEFPEGSLLSNIDTFLVAEGGDSGFGAHYATYEAAVLGFGSQDELKKLRAGAVKPKLNLTGSRPPLKKGPFKDSRHPNRSCFMFPGSDSAVIKRSQELLTKDNPNHASAHVGCYFSIEEGMLNNAKMMVYGGLFQFLSQYEKGRQWLLQYPEKFSNGLFSREGPSEEQIKGMKFQMDIYGSGYKNASVASSSELPPPDKSVHLRVRGPDPGYVATSSMIVLSALAIIKQREALPQSGIVTPGYAFRNCPWLVDQLKKENVFFEVVE